MKGKDHFRNVGLDEDNTKMTVNKKRVKGCELDSHV